MYIVPILTQSENWALYLKYCFCSDRILFQSSPSPKTGRYLGIPTGTLSNPSGSNPHPVRKLGAILRRDFLSELGFQSSPSPKTGRYYFQSSHPEFPHRFQSSPSPKTGRYLALELASMLFAVPILTQSENWALLVWTFPVFRAARVPILTQSENWALCCHRK